MGACDKNYQGHKLFYGCIFELKKISRKGDRHMTKRIGIGFLIVTLLFSITACDNDSKEYKAAIEVLKQQELQLDGSNEVSEELVIALKTADYKKPKNIIFMIGDGMGYNATEAAETYYQEKLYQDTLAMYHLPVQGTSTTYSVTNQVTDSAAGGTALSTGFKTGNKIVAKSADKSKEYKTTLELAAEKGKSTGIVVTTPVVDATPASFTAHVDVRESYEEIAATQLEKLLDGTLDLVLGGGRTYYEGTENQSSLEKAKKAGVAYTNTWEETKKANLPVVGLYADEELDTTDETIPSIAKMTDYALTKLSEDENGFFLMVEGAQIDDFAEHNNLEMELKEIYDFDCAVAVAMRYVALHPDTVLIVTADHETGDVDYPNAMNAEDVFEQTTYGTELHTYKSVPVLAAGYRTEELTGTQENTDIGIFVASLLGEEEFGEKGQTQILLENKKEVEITLKDKKAYELPMKELEEGAKELQSIKVLHVTLENKTEEVLPLPSLEFVYRKKEYIVEAQKGYIHPGETIQIDYPIPENVLNRKLMSNISDVQLSIETGTATYSLKSIGVTSRSGLK